MDREIYLVGVHPFSHALECEGKIWGGKPALPCGVRIINVLIAY